MTIFSLEIKEEIHTFRNFTNCNLPKRNFLNNFKDGDEVSSVAVTNNGKYIGVGTTSATLCILDAEAKSLAHKFTDTAEGIFLKLGFPLPIYEV